MKQKQETDLSAGCDLRPPRAWSHVEVGEQDGACTVTAVRKGRGAVGAGASPNREDVR